jgi:hypothetical protein
MANGASEAQFSLYRQAELCDVRSRHDVVKARKVVLATAYTFAFSAWAQTNYVVQFDRQLYEVKLGETFLVDVLYEPASLAGLYSYAVKLSFDEVKAKVADLSSIGVPPALDFNGVLGHGAYRATGPGFAGVKGTIDFFAQPLNYYPGSLLASFAVTDRSLTPGQYTLSLSGFNTLGPTESLFVDGQGQVLDSAISFGTATVRVVPEPAILCLISVGGLGLALSRRVLRPTGVNARPAGTSVGSEFINQLEDRAQR